MLNKGLMEIPLKDINQKDRTFCLSFPLSPFPLSNFIKETGFISPLILRKKKGEKRYQIVSGFRRIEAFKNRIFKKIPAFIFSESELPNKKAILLSFYDNLSQRYLNEIEKSMAIEKLHSLGKISEEKLINFFLPLLGLPRSKKYLEKYLALERIEEAFKKSIAQNEISLEIGIILAKFSLQERKRIFNLIKRLRLNQNKAKEIITLLKEISRREEKSINSLLSEEVLKDYRDFSNFRDYLLNRRYPEFKAYEKKFFNLAKSLKLSPEIKISPPAFFESDRLKINLEIKQEKELEKIISSLKRAFKSKEFSKLLSML